MKMSAIVADRSNASISGKFEYGRSNSWEGVPLCFTTRNTSHLGQTSVRVKGTDSLHSPIITPKNQSSSFHRYSQSPTDINRRTPLSERLELPAELLPSTSKHFSRRNQLAKNPGIFREHMNTNCSSPRKKTRHLRSRSVQLGKFCDDKPNGTGWKISIYGEKPTCDSSDGKEKELLTHSGSPVKDCRWQQHQNVSSMQKYDKLLDEEEDEEEGCTLPPGTPIKSYKLKRPIDWTREREIACYPQSRSRKEFLQVRGRSQSLGSPCDSYLKKTCTFAQSRNQIRRDRSPNRKEGGNAPSSDDPIGDLINKLKRSCGLLNQDTSRQQSQHYHYESSIALRNDPGSKLVGKGYQESIGEEMTSHEEFRQSSWLNRQSPLVKFNSDKETSATGCNRRDIGDNLSVAISETPGLLYAPSSTYEVYESRKHKQRFLIPSVRTSELAKRHSFKVRKNSSHDGFARTLPQKMAYSSECTDEVWLSRLLDGKVKDSETARELSFNVPTNKALVPVNTFTEFLTRYGIGIETCEYLARKFKEHDGDCLDLRNFFDSLEVKHTKEVFQDSVYNTMDKLMEMDPYSTRNNDDYENHIMRRSSPSKVTTMPYEESSRGSWTLGPSTTMASVSFPYSRSRVKAALGYPDLSEEGSLRDKYEGGIFVTKYPYKSSIFANPKMTKLELVEDKNRSLTWGMSGKKIYLSDIKKLTIGLRSQTFKRFESQIINKGVVQPNQCMSVHTNDRTLDVVFKSADESRDFKRYLETYLP